MTTKGFKVKYKSTELISILRNHFGKEMNFARISFNGYRLFCFVFQALVTKSAIFFSNFDVKISYICLD
jgi:hypothetical protein